VDNADRTKRIVHFVSLDTVGGVELLFRDIISWLTPQRFEHHVALYTSSIHKQVETTIKDKITSSWKQKYWKSVKIPGIPAQLRRWVNGKIVRSLSPDILIYWNTFNNNHAYGSHSNKPVQILVDQGTSWYQPHVSQSRSFLSHIQKVICCSEASKQILRLHYGYEGKATVLSNPLRPLFREISAQGKKYPTGRSLKVGMAGRLVNVKGMAIGLHALSGLLRKGMDVELHIAGVGPLDNDLRSLSDRLGISDRTFFHGLVSDMRLFFQSIDLFMIPSIREPFGLVALESMACGCPAVASFIDGLPETVKNGLTGICVKPRLSLDDYELLGGGLRGLPSIVYDPVDDRITTPMALDPVDVADAISSIVENNARYEAMSERCIIEARKHEGFSEYVGKFEALLTE